MKKVFSFFVASFLAICLTIPAFAAENTVVYDASFVPPIPSFIREYSDWYYGNGTQITCGFTGKLGFDYASYPQDDVFPVVVLLSQGCYNKYNEENNIDYDREYTLYYILLRKYHGNSNDYSLGSFLHKGGPQHTMFMGSGNCMQYVLNSNFEYSFIKMDYNWEGGYFESNEDMHHVSQGSLSFFPFAYGFTFFVGRQGAGKTISMVRYLEVMKERYPDCLIVTNFQYYRSNYIMTDWRDLLFVRNGEKGVIFAIDEIHSEYDSSKWADIPEELLSEISQQRKQRIKIIASSQFFTRVAKPLREQAMTVVSCKTLLGRLTINREYDSLEYATVVDNPLVVQKKVKPLRKSSFVQSDFLRRCYDTYAKVERMRKTKFIPRSSRGAR